MDGVDEVGERHTRRLELFRLAWHDKSVSRSMRRLSNEAYNSPPHLRPVASSLCGNVLYRSTVLR